jgi:hypothetical protein
MIDVGSDTVSAPMLARQRATAGAPVGRDPSVVAVQHPRFAELWCHAGTRAPPRGAHGVRAVVHFDDGERVADVCARVLVREAA